MTWPTIQYQAAFGAYPFAFAGGTYVDLAAYVTQLTIISPTRSRMLDTFRAGTMTATLDNADRRFDPTNLSGPYVSGGRSQIIPNLPVRAVATYSATNYSLSTCFRDSGGVTWADPSWSETVWAATDGFKLLGRAPIAASSFRGGGDGEQSGARINRILDNMGWAGGAYRSVATGLNRMQASYLDMQPLQELQLVAASEGGELWCAGNGAVTFKDRSYRTSTTSWTFSDASGSNDYTDLELSDDDDVIVNFASITRVGGSAQVAFDATSQDSYGYSTTGQWQRTDLVMYDDAEAAGIAWLAVDVNADSIVRFSSMTVDPTVNDALWTFVLGMQLGDRVTITKTPPGGGSAITRKCFVEGWRHDITPGNGGTQGVWRTEVILSNAEGAWDDTFFVLDSSLLDGAHVLLW